MSRDLTKSDRLGPLQQPQDTNQSDPVRWKRLAVEEIRTSRVSIWSQLEAKPAKGREVEISKPEILAVKS